jgi:DNA primase
LSKLSAKQKELLLEATRAYHESLPGSPAEEYLETRGLLAPSVRDEVETFGLGFVKEPLPGHEPYRGMLAIPYYRRSAMTRESVVTIRYRCLNDDCNHGRHPGQKYASMPGHPPRLYNTEVLTDDTLDAVAICEGEIDAITATICGIPAVGIAGVETWKPHFRDSFLGYAEVYILADGDDPGMRFATSVAEKLPNAIIHPCRDGEDVNSTVVKYGKKALLEKVRKKK